MKKWPHDPIQQRQHRALNSILLGVVCLLLSILTLAPIVSLKIRRDREGNPVLKADGQLARERDYVGEVLDQPLPYGAFALSIVLFVRAAAIRSRPIASSSR
jgi:hypothetical protein